jgi:hypothetical protein
MKDKEELSRKIGSEKIQIFEMIEASCNLAGKKGKHNLEPGCNCIACINQRKRRMQGSERNWKFRI